MSDFYNKYPYTDFHELNLDWVIERVKKLTEDWVATLEEWNSTEEQWQELYNYVHDYFDNLDVQQEINNKINAMIVDGTFQQIATPIIQAKVAADLPGVVSQQIGGVVSDQIDQTVAQQIGTSVSEQIGDAVVNPVNAWLSAHITQPTVPAIDDTLTIQGAAADAAAAGLRIDNMESYCRGTLDKFNIEVLYPQLFDYSARHDGFYYRYYDDTIHSNASMYYTDLIPVNASHISATLEHIIVINCYDNTKTFISGSVYNSAGFPNSQNIELPAGTAFIRISGTTADDQYLMVNPGYVPLPYFPYRKGIKWTYGDTTSRLTSTGNLMDITNYVDKYYINQDTFVVTQNDDYFYSQVINIKPNTYYTTAAQVSFVFFDKDLLPISGRVMNYVRQGVKTFQSVESPANAIFLIVTGQKSLLSTLIISEGGALGDTVTYTETIEEIDLPKLNGIEVLFMGDSLTHGVIGGSSPDYHWNQSNITFANIASKIAGFNESEAGWPGASALSYYTTVSQNNGGPTNGYPFPVRTFDAFCIMLGTNQGLTDTLDTDVFPYSDFHDFAATNTGGYCALIEYIYSINPDAQIIILTPPYANDSAGREAQQNTTYTVLKKIADHYNLMLIDVFKESGISAVNYQNYMPVDGLHLTVEGYHKLGTFIGNKLTSCLSW